MRRAKKYVVFTAAIFCTLNSIIAQKKEVVYHFPADTAAVDKLLPDYIDLVDGKKVEGKITNVSLIKKYVYDKVTGIITIGGTEYDIKDIKGYQYQGVYLSRADSKKHMIVRLKHGKINFYKVNMDAKISNGNWVVEFQWLQLEPTRHLIQKGEDGEIDIFSIKKLEKYVSDYQPAMDIIKQYWENKTAMDSEKYLEKAIDVYNSR
jgi:hypothetical protein